MLFNSYEFIFIFLPASLLGYYLLQKLGKPQSARFCLLLFSFVFYSWWNISYFPLLLGSILFNFSVGWLLNGKTKGDQYRRKILVTAGVAGNLGLLGFYKYSDFFIANVNQLVNTDFPSLNLLLPLAISFFTFQQIAYVVDTYRGEAEAYGFIDYALFVSFFPQLIAGPIVHHGEMIKQFLSPENWKMRYSHLAPGIYIFFMGLFKKVVIADTLSRWAVWGFDNSLQLTLLEAWITSLAYTLQLYFDFSGYTDMATGAALMFNIKLPVNFNSPYKATDIQDFWRRWHMTLSRFLRNYIYIPLGGNRQGVSKTCLNLMITFLLGGLWHGAGWTFIFWGFLHGLALVIQRLWQQTGLTINRGVAWLLTFNFVNLAWVFFRAKTWTDAEKVLQGMLGANGLVFPAGLANYAGSFNEAGITFGNLNIPDGYKAAIFLALGLLLCFLAPNSNQFKDRFKPDIKNMIFTAGIAIAAIICLLQVSEFLYFNF